ncbi:MAG: outer membrane lipoprotein-sorting protein [Myxococcota bacterium]
MCRIVRRYLVVLTVTGLLGVAGSGLAVEPVPTPTPAAEADKPADPNALPAISAVLAKLDDLYRSSGSEATMTMEVKTRNYERSLTMESWSRGEDEALIVIRSPAREAGTATLRTEEGLWNYAPRADRLIRIPSGLLSDGWMGSHVTNDDLMRESSYEKDYTTSAAWADEGGKRLLRLTMTPKKDAAIVYTKVEFYLTADEWLPVRADYFDDAEIVRRFHYRDVKTLGGRRIPTLMEVVPTDKPGEYTRMRYDKMKFDVKVTSDTFTPRGVRRAASLR